MGGLMAEIYLRIHSVIPDAETLLAYEPEELAEVLMARINDMPSKYRDAMKPQELIAHSDVHEYPHFHQGSAQKALMEAWACLERDGFVALLPDDNQGLYFITRKGERRV
jgi:hypothetical protein